MPALRLVLKVALLWAFVMTAQAALVFPPLTGQVVDTAQLLDAQSKAQLTQRLQAHEQATGEQLVVVTVPDLQGASIEDYGYQLGRAWGIGQKGKDSGALLIVARDDRKVRIEVGYGLEDRLTDAQSSVIINQVITPAFRVGNFAGGISLGAEAIIKVLGGGNVSPEQAAQQPGHQPASFRDVLQGFVGIVLFLVFIYLNISGGGGGSGRGAGFVLGALLGSLGNGRSGGGSGGGFSGGGGSFGGGGASGGW